MKRYRLTRHERVLDISEPEMKITCVMATGGVQDDGIALNVEGYRIWGGGDSIPLLWLHGLDVTRGHIPLGSVRNIRVENVDGEKVLVGDKYYYRSTDASESDLSLLPRLIFDMRRQGHFSAVSIGFDAITERTVADGEQTYRLFDSWWLFELSDCPVGMDAKALDVLHQHSPALARWVLGGVRSVVPFEATPTMPQDAEWDAAEARARLVKWASKDGSGDKDTIDWAKYRRGFLWVDTEAGVDNFGSYYLPHHDVVDGRPKVNFRGCVAALVSLRGGRGGVPEGMSETDIARAEAHLRRHYDQFGAEFPERGIPETDTTHRAVVLGEQATQQSSRLLEMLGRLSEWKWKGGSI